MSYASVDQLMRPPYLKQIGAADKGALQAVLDDATAIIDTYLGYSFDTAEVGSQIVYGRGTDRLALPAYVEGSITSITSTDGGAIPSYVEEDGTLIALHNGRRRQRYNGYTVHGSYDIACGGWGEGIPYTVTATFGYEEAPRAIQHACLQLAVSIWLGAGNGYTGVVGVEGAGVTRTPALPAAVKLVLDNYKANSGVGVW